MTRTPVDDLCDRMGPAFAALCQRGHLAWDSSREWQRETRRGEGRGSGRSDPTAGMALERFGAQTPDVLAGTAHVRLATKLAEAIAALDAVTALVGEITSNWDPITRKWVRPKRQPLTGACEVCADIVPGIGEDRLIRGLCRQCYDRYHHMTRSTAAPPDMTTWKAREIHRLAADIAGEA